MVQPDLAAVGRLKLQLLPVIGLSVKGEGITFMLRRDWPSVPLGRITTLPMTWRGRP